MLKGDLFVSSLIRKNEDWKCRSGKEGSKQEHVFTLLEEEGGEGKQRDIRTLWFHQLWPHCFY